MKPALDHFNFCPSCGKSEIERTKSVAVRCRACGLQYFMSPTVSAAALIEDEEGRILVVKRGKNPRKGKLGLPGGFADPGETLEETLQRETKEEVNLELESWSFLGGWPNQYAFESVIYTVVDTYFIARARNFESIQTCQEELESIHFVYPREVHENEWAFPSLQNAIRCYLDREHTS